jgi:predicted ATPase
MIHKLNFRQLNNKFDRDFVFHPELNLFTGKNGCGKTTVLKLLWYLTSGNIELLFREVNFEYVYFKSDNTEAEITIEKKDEDELINGFYKSGGLEKKFKGLKKSQRPERLEPIIRSKLVDRSIFFPTFRRIEGGFSIDNPKEEYVFHKELNQRIYLGGGPNDLNQAINELSRRITPNRFNRFIASISTNDITILLNEKYTEILEKIRMLENDQSSVILKKLKNRKQDVKVLDEIEKLVQDTDSKKDDLLKPFTVLSHLIQEIFLDKSIRITGTLTLGEAQEAIISDKLSAGEKQMLSFLCYNFFSDNTSIFIDEPELSLHTDWQRILVPTLLEQSKNNQFFIATHSPFIYSKYPEKEHILDFDKGENQ